MQMEENIALNPNVFSQSKAPKSSRVRNTMTSRGIVPIMDPKDSATPRFSAAAGAVEGDGRSSERRKQRNKKTVRCPHCAPALARAFFRQSQSSEEDLVFTHAIAVMINTHQSNPITCEFFLVYV